ncbi:SPTBN5 [Cordylochernes scorpioides]|uniref:SPTBN5 n=1 Tax=Cordylochernes scorpioides TaxID=51811 RepID=A0ABY6K0C1_9ARAC|nr:SPTBN5 [Cordylochernes scorpioides]
MKNVIEHQSDYSTLDEVEALLKRHDNFTNTLIAQEERLRLFSEMADKLIAAHHYDSPQIDEKRHQVLARRKVVQEKAQQRRKELLSAHAYQYFLAEVHEDKLKVASDESYRELINLEAKLKKHEAFEAEVKANQDRLHVIKTHTVVPRHMSAPNIRVFRDTSRRASDFCFELRARYEFGSVVLKILICDFKWEFFGEICFEIRVIQDTSKVAERIKLVCRECSERNSVNYSRFLSDSSVTISNQDALKKESPTIPNPSREPCLADQHRHPQVHSRTVAADGYSESDTDSPIRSSSSPRHKNHPAS